MTEKISQIEKISALELYNRDEIIKQLVGTYQDMIADEKKIKKK